ncbi:fatty acid desaturase [Actinocorallia sp. API 0066]|uniref:acyl-CoA desaturase n=1 Tax=Actinocorallia sp. API 0066 TaxID=2896846 RepID=UPI001E3960A9|nr:fatty acid desaturase [Actinocorallia sp. API 0066]MCD0448227.1 fatty acid desaturase [Actinocorallia sp. API 0066]
MDGKEHKLFIIAASVIPLLGVVAVMVLLWNRVFGWSDLVVLAVMYTIAGLGVSIGYHRMLAHRAFRTHRWIYDAFAVAGTMAAQGPAIIWTAHHRRHHRVADKDGDPHSPYHGGTGRLALVRGLWHAHLGWLMDEKLTSDPLRYCPDLARDRHLRWISRHFVAIVVAGMLLPAALGFALTGSALGALTGFLWGGLARIFILNHITYAINSVGHVYGRRRFSTPDESRNVAWLSLASFGESWHNNHHAFPRSASHGMRWYEPDVSALVIGTLRRVGLAWDVITIDRARQEARAEGLARAGGGRHAAHQPAAPMAERMVDPALTRTTGDVE